MKKPHAQLLLELEPGLKPSVPGLVEELFSKARRVAEKEMGQKTTLTGLTWGQVFEEEYDLM